MSNISCAKYVWMNGKTIEWEKAHVHVSSSAVLYGAGVFEGIKAYKSSNGRGLYLFRLEDHVKRLFGSAKVHRMDVPFSTKAIEEAIIKLIEDNGFTDDTYVRPLIYPGDFFELMGGKAPIDVTIFAVPYSSQDHSQKVEKGIKCCVSSWRRISDSSLPARVKTCGNYVNSRLAKSEARMSGFDDAILLTKEGFVSEGSGANLFLVRNNALVTPDVSFDILEGITRASIIAIADDLGYAVRERGVVRSELYTADEVFLCGTVAELLPVVSIDNIAVGDGKPGNLTKNLQNHFFQIARGKSSKHKDWLRAIHEE